MAEYKTKYTILNPIQDDLSEPSKEDMKLKGSLKEDTRSALINKSKGVGLYKDTSRGRNRFERKKYSKIANQVKSYNQIDMNDFFKRDILKVKIPVIGETDTYDVTIKMEGVVAEIAKNIKSNHNKLEYRTIIQSLTKVFNTTNIYTKCTCLDKNTKIKLLDGTVPTVEEMKTRFDAGEQLYVYSVDENGDFVPGVVEGVYITGKCDHFIEVTLDNGEKIRTTPDHPYLLRTGQYVEAQQLQLGQSLMPIYFSKTDNGYETVKFNSTGKYYSTYKVVGNTFYPQEIEFKKQEALNDGSVEKMRYDVAIHHRDFNKDNNSPDNLQIMTAYEHWMYHANIINRLWADPKWAAEAKERSRAWMTWLNKHPTKKMTEARRSDKGKWACNWDQEWKQWHDALVSQKMTEYWSVMSEEEKEHRAELIGQHIKDAWITGKFDTDKFHEARKREIKKLHTPEMKAKAVEGIKAYWLGLTEEEKVERLKKTVGLQKGQGWNKGKHLTEEDRLHKSLAMLNRTSEEKAAHSLKIRDAKYIKVFKKMIEDGIELTEDNYELYRNTYFIKSPRLRKHFNSITEATSYFKLNHKIIDIKEIYCEADDVYDIKVKDYHNFLVNAGVILHNCPDHLYNYAHWNIINNVSVDDTAHDPGPGKNIKNPNDDKGRGCKHILLVLSNGDWMMKVASVINNYIHYAEEHMQKAFMKLIFPKLYGIPADEAVENNLVPEETNMDTEPHVIEVINKWAADRGKIKKGSNINPVYADRLQKEQEKDQKQEKSGKKDEKSEEEEK